MSAPVLLDLCSGQGGAAQGYRRAGFTVVGCDTRKACGKRYPGDFLHMDALEALELYSSQVDAVHASPPCQRWTHGNVANDTSEYPDLITPIRAALLPTGLPYIIENVPRAPLRNPMRLCGTMFGLGAIDTDGTRLRLQRHRLFESNVFLYPPGPCRHKPDGAVWAGAYGGARRTRAGAAQRHGGYVPSAPVMAQLLGIDWMTEAGMYESIPPAYTQHLGSLLMAKLEWEAAQ